MVAVDGDSVLSLIAFTAALYQHPSYQVLRVDVLRGTEKLSFRVSGFAQSSTFKLRFCSFLLRDAAIYCTYNHQFENCSKAQK